MKQLFLVLVAAALCQSCHQARTTENTGTAETVAALTDADIFQANVIRNYLRAHPGQDNKANALFMQAIDAYRNKKDIATAQGLFFKSILQHPTAKAYYELGNAYLDVKDYAKALSAYHIGEQLGFEPLSKLLYNMACAHSLSQQPDSAVAYLEYAMEAGYTNADQILKDPDLATARQSEHFQTVYQTAMSGTKDPETVAWQSFKRGFIPASFPLVLNKETEKELNNDRYISYDFEKFVPEMKGERFSREVGKEFYYLAKVDDRPAFTTVVYAVRQSMMGENAPIAFMMVSFSPKGKLIDKMVAGGQMEPQDLYRVATVQQSGQMEIREYKQVYEKDPAENGYSENKLLSSDLQQTRHYRIGNDGHFEQDHQMVGMR